MGNGKGGRGSNEAGLTAHGIAAVKNHVGEWLKEQDETWRRRQGWRGGGREGALRAA